MGKQFGQNGNSIGNSIPHFRFPSIYVASIEAQMTN
jgi:hypothetical protein